MSDTHAHCILDGELIKVFDDVAKHALMAEKAPILDSVQTEKGRASTLPAQKGEETLVIIFEVEDSPENLPQSLQDLVYGEKYGTGQTMASANEGMHVENGNNFFTHFIWWCVLCHCCTSTVKESLGKRVVHNISIETHLPRLGKWLPSYAGWYLRSSKNYLLPPFPLCWIHRIWQWGEDVRYSHS